jgi:hypothetical protein
VSFAVAAVIVAASGCATIFATPSQSIRIETEPPGATVTVDEHRVKTPAVVRLPRASRLASK